MSRREKCAFNAQHIRGEEGEGSRAIKKEGSFSSLCEHTAGRSFDVTLVLSGTPAYADIVCQCPINVADEDNCEERERQSAGGGAAEEKREKRRGRTSLFFGADSVLKEFALFSHLFFIDQIYAPDLPPMFSESSVNLTVFHDNA